MCVVVSHNRFHFLTVDCIWASESLNARSRLPVAGRGVENEARRETNPAANTVRQIE